MVRVMVARAASKNTMSLVTKTGRRISLHMSPAGFGYQNVATFGEIEREGRKTLTRATGPGLKSLSFTNRVASGDPTVSIEPVLKRLLALAEDGERVRFTGGSPELEQSAWWHIRGLDVTVVHRATNNQPSNVELSWELVESVDVTADIVKPKPKPRKPPKKAKPSGGVTRVHRVVRGDTLWAISAKYLGDPTRWPEIYRLNRKLIRHPDLIYPGQRFKIGPR